MIENNARENYTRVTKILSPLSGLDKIDPEIVAHAGERGSKVHKICEAIIQGFGEIGVDDETRPYIESFKQWWGTGHKIISMEERFWCDELKITGQVDLILETENGLAIVDLKTSSKPSPTWEAQGNAYAYLAKKSGYDIKRILFIHLLRTSKEPKIYEYTIDPSFFFCVYRVWKHFFNKD